jgi:eukaryotic-like serine/threonine-protein kinase
MVIDEKDVFVAALALPDAEEREAYLQAACAGHPELLGRLRELLSAHEESQGPLDRRPAALGVTADAAHIEGHGSVIGPYKLLQQIGEGGMGTVFMAEQTEPVKRKVALKIIKPGMDSRQVIARFEAERQALAMMDHVNIARVLDAGATEAGLPYFVMELVHGVPITKYCDDNHLTPRERLELFVPVCQAIQHAHQKGIIHRDIKPSNVMVTLYDGKPVPKVIDFGVAKATEQKLTERTLFTQYGATVGTLEYMSPEQAEMSALGVDTRSDIYSLGVLLYELLTGSTPLSHKRVKEAAYGEVLRMIKEEEPPRPSTRLSDSGAALASISARRHMEPAKLTKLVRGELDWIVMKTLEKDRNRRYETAKDFAADVQRYLNDEPIQARAITMPQRMWRWYRRHVPLVAGAYTVFTFAIIGVMGIAMTSIVQFLITSPNATDLLTALGTFPVFAFVIFLGVESGIAAFRGKRRGLWISLIAFGLIGLTSWWSLYWSIAISREISPVPVASFRVLRPDTFDGWNAYVRNCVIGYALLSVIWYSAGFVLQVHALCSRAADQNLDARRSR